MKNLDFQAIFLQQKRNSATENIYLTLINSALVYIVQLNIFWKKLHAFH